MKFIKILGNMIAWMVFLAFCAVLATFFIAVFNADGVLRAFEVFKGLFGG